MNRMLGEGGGAGPVARKVVRLGDEPPGPGPASGDGAVRERSYGRASTPATRDDRAAINH